MTIIKYTEAKTEVLQRAISMIDNYKLKAPLWMIKQQAEFAGAEDVAKAKTFKAAYKAMIAFYEMALLEEEAHTLVVL